MKRSLVALATLIAAASLANPASARTLQQDFHRPHLFRNTGKQKAQWKQERRGRR